MSINSVTFIIASCYQSIWYTWARKLVSILWKLNIGIENVEDGTPVSTCSLWMLMTKYVYLAFICGTPVFILLTLLSADNYHKCEPICAPKPNSWISFFTSLERKIAPWICWSAMIINIISSFIKKKETKISSISLKTCLVRPFRPVVHNGFRCRWLLFGWGQLQSFTVLSVTDQ